jgi:hypothetical protein
MSPSQFRVERAGLRFVESSGDLGSGPASDPQLRLKQPLRNTACPVQAASPLSRLKIPVIAERLPRSMRLALFCQWRDHAKCRPCSLECR